MRFRPILASLLALGLLTACGGGGSSSTPAAPTGTLTLRLGSDSFPGYSQAVVSILKVEGSLNGAVWVALGEVRATVDLLGLQNGRSVVILPATTVPTGTYDQFRLTWAAVNYQSSINLPAYVIPTGGAGQPMTMPTTTTLGSAVTVGANASITAQLMLNGQQAVQSRAGSAYAFQATGRAYDTAASARITGHLSSGSTPLAGVEVYAETLDGSGLATVQRRAFSDGSGNYVLEGLPTGSLYFVTALPAGSVTTYAAAAAAPVNAIAATTSTADLTFGAPVAPGSLTLTLTPPSTATQGTWGELRQTVATGGTGSQVLIVRSQTAATGISQDLVGFLGLAPGTYGVTAQRSTAGATPVLNTGAQVQVSAGGTATLALSYP